MQIKTVLLATVATVVAFPAFAQTASPEASQVEDVIVTARKRSEDIQTVPIAITAYTAQDLENRSISNLNDLSNSTPGVAVTSISGGNVLSIYLRGLAPANTSNDLNVDANVGTFIDGIYQTSRNTLDIISILDVGQIEIAKGPQSAIYGRSTFAGALGITTRLPSVDQSATISGTVGTDDDYRLRGSISMPIIQDVLAARVSAGYLTYDGYGENSAAPDDNLGGYEKYGASGAVVFTPNDRFTATLTGFATKSRTEVSPFTLLPLSANNCGLTNAASGAATLFCGELQAQEISSLSPLPDNLSETRQAALDLTYEFDRFSVVSVTGITRADNHAYGDYDGSGDGILFGVCGAPTVCATGANVPYSRTVRANVHSASVEKVETFSQEFRIQSKDDTRFQWMLGAYYFDSQVPLAAGGLAAERGNLQNGESLVQVLPNVPAGTGPYDFTMNFFLVADPNGVNAARYGSIAVASTETKSLFGSVGYSLTEQLRVSAEGRYNIDDKTAQNFAAVGGNQIITSGLFTNAGTKFNKEFESFTPRFTIDYQWTPDFFLYGSAAKGVRSGGFNTAAVVSATGILADEVAYGEEENWTYEAGFKSRLFDRRLLLNASVFHVDWKDAQITSFTANPTAAVGTTAIVRNAGDIKTTGFEVQADFDINDLFSVGGSATYSDPQFQDGAFDTSSVSRCGTVTSTACTIVPFTQANGTVRLLPSVEGNLPQRAVKLSWNLHATVDAPLSGDWSLSGRVDVNHTGEAYNNLINTTSFGEKTLANLRIGVDNGRYSAFLFANNLFDETYVVNSINQPRAGIPFQHSVPEIYLGEGRRIGLTLTAKY